MRNLIIISKILIFFPEIVFNLAIWGKDPEKMTALGKKMKEFFESLGGIYLKFGQILALRIDLLPLEVCAELRNLFDSVKPFSFEYTKSLFHQDFDKEINEVFESFSEKPIASASIGQVYKARLKSGEEVAVKVLRPNIKEQAKHDLGMIKGISGFLNLMTLGRFRISEVAAEFESWIWEETDYRNEAKNIQKLADFRSSELPLFDIPLKLNVPKVYIEYSSPNFLVMEFIHGITVNEIIKMRKNKDQTEYNSLVRDGFKLKEVVRQMILCLIKQLYIDGVFNADPHPANIIVTPDNRIYYIDFGLIGELDKKHRLSVFRFLRSMTVFDYETAFDAAMIMFDVKDEKKARKLREVIKEIVFKLKVAAQNEKGSYLQFSQKSTLELLKTIMGLGLSIPVEVSRSLRAAVTSDGLMQSLYPEGDFKEMTTDMYKASIALTYLNVMDNLKPEKIKYWILKLVNFVEAESMKDY